VPFAINARCNFNCSFCDKQWSAEDAVDDETVFFKAPISELSGLRAVLGGGEPTLHPRLPHLLAGLKEQGVRRIALRSNGAWAARSAPVAFLKKKGLGEVTLLFPTHDPEQFDRLVRKTGAFEAVMKGVANLVENKVRISLRIPLIQPTLDALPEIIPAVAALVPSARRIDLVHLDIKDPALQVRIEDINRVLPHGSDHPWEGVPELLLDPGAGVALCRRDELAAWRITPDDPTARGHKPAGCGGCYLKNSCPGVLRGTVDVFGEDAVVRPYTLGFEPERAVARPERGGEPRPDQHFESVKGVTYECPEDGSGEATIASVRLRVGHKCNRRCTFCFIPHHEKAVHDHDIRASIQAAVEKGVRELVMTGGEPTLQKDLPEYIEQARDGGVRRIILQTNAMKLANEEFCQELVDKGLTHVVISLHSHRDDVLRQITGLKNTMPKILRSIDNLHRAGLQMSVTHVITPENFRHMPEFVRFMVEQSHIRRFCFIFATPMAAPMATEALIPRYSDAAPYLMNALEYCVENDVLVDGLSFKCGAPHCVVGGDPRFLVGAVKIPEQNRTKDWMEVPACKSCVLRDQCYGVRRLYVWMYGADEFQPVLDPSLRVDAVAGGPTQSAALPALQTKSAGPSGDQMRELITGVGETLGLPAAGVRAALRPSQSLSLVLRGADGQEVPALRVRYGRGVDHVGGIESTTQLDAASCTTTALLRHLRAAALGLDLGGAHGMVQATAADDTTGLLDQTGLLHEYVQALHPTRRDGVDHLTPHTSTRWPDVEAAVDRYREQRAGTPLRVGALRRTPTGALAGLRMTSVDSAVAAAVGALLHLGEGTESRITYAVWGYGRAGQAFADRMDRVEVFGRARPMLVGAADSKSGWVQPNGLEHERITAFKQRNGRIPAGAGVTGDPTAVLRMAADVLLLSGRGRPLDADAASRVQARVVVDMTGGVSPDVERVLHHMGVVFVPSPVATAGPLVIAALEREGPLPSLAGVRDAIRTQTQRLLAGTLALSASHGLSPTQALIGLALRRLVAPAESRSTARPPPS
jgi:molybdenum cofactor biosynthesis enzyme MoaA/glutamate dehydrogenase/leucine dehydrogenase